MDKKIKHSKPLAGQVLLFGGVYSNLQALEAIKEEAERLTIDPQNCICTGDIIGYCAQPEETLQLFKAWGAQSIAGNVELQLSNGSQDCGCDYKEGSRCDSFSQLWYPYAQRKLSQDSIQFISQLPDHISFQYAGKKVFVAHGSYNHISEFIFKSTPWQQKKINFEKTKANVIIAGHCGLPFFNQVDDDLWLNPGVIGMPANDGATKVWYAVLNDTNGLHFKHHTLQYDYKTTHQLMLKNNLPQAYAKTIITGIWDNTEILPPQETKQQGLAIKF